VREMTDKELYEAALKIADFRPMNLARIAGVSRESVYNWRDRADIGLSVFARGKLNSVIEGAAK
jgi:hypothetical protein